jgi:ribonuclease HI
MHHDSIFIYSDASFDKNHDLAIIGFGIFNSSDEHNIQPMTKIHVTLLKIKESNNIRAEIRAALYSLENIPSIKKVKLFTDCQTLCGLPSRRQGLEEKKFISKSKNLPLANSELYQEFYQAFDRLHIELIWVKGHTPKEHRTRVENNFSFLDKLVREKLRQQLYP